MGNHRVEFKNQAGSNSKAIELCHPKVNLWGRMYASLQLVTLKGERYLSCSPSLSHWPHVDKTLTMNFVRVDQFLH
jgi:hypothetical protein